MAQASLLVVDRAELAAVIAEALQVAIAGTKVPNPKALTNKQLQEQYSISPGTVKRLRRQGMPHFFIGDSPRYSADDVHAWIMANGGSK